MTSDERGGAPVSRAPHGAEASALFGPGANGSSSRVGAGSERADAAAPRSAAVADLFHVDGAAWSAPRALAPERASPFVAPPARTHGPRSLARRIARRAAWAFPRAVVMLLLAWGLGFNFSEVRGSSMEPGIHDRDRILVDHVSYLVGDVQRGDIVILRYPLDPDVDYIKRVVGVPGDEVVLASGNLWVNGVLVDEPYVDEHAIDPYTYCRVRVEPGHYFVLGDNRLRSSDSREFGQVAHELLRGKVQCRVWPLERVGWIR